ncbi:hypothetical protein ACPF8X_08425 [Streptomyces sp. G35A]
MGGGAVPDSAGEALPEVETVTAFVKGAGTGLYEGPSTSPGCPGGEYGTHGLGIEPDLYDPEPAVDFTLLREGDLNVVGLDQAA